MKVGMISLGCPRNLVDSELILGLLKDKGYTIVSEIARSDIAIVNTCAFIKDATDESLETILSLIALKEKKRIKHIIVAGCLPQRYKKDLRKELKEVDGFIGTSDLMRIDTVIDKVLTKHKGYAVSKVPKLVYSDSHKRDLISPRHSIYIKIQEGCANNCSYCVIPIIRGGLRSRPIDSILKEIKGLSGKKGISELNIIGQDTTLYGYDLYKEKKIPDLLRKIASLNTSKWIRLLYTHPAHYTDDLIAAIRDTDAVCKYVDLPVQHISDKILRKMKRSTSSDSIRLLIGKLRKEIPNMAIRSTVMVGFPGETDSDFKKLLNFIKEVRFERLGAFIYSNEEGSSSYKFKDQITDRVKGERLQAVMELQKEISREYNESFINKRLEVMIDEKNPDEDAGYIGRTEFDAPSVDGQVFVRGGNFAPGDFVNVKIVDTLEYDLVGVAE